MKERSSRNQMRGRLVAPALLFVAAIFAAAPPSSAQPNETQIAAYQQASESDRVKLLIHLAKNGGHDDVDWLLQNYPLQGPHAANRTIYIEGLILRARGDLTGAVEKFRSALASDPKLTLVRADLAQTLVVLEQDDSAVYHLKQLQADAPTEDAAKDLQSFMEKVDERSPLKKSFWIAAAPSSNANNGSTKPHPDSPLWKPEKPKNAFGVAAGAQLGFSKRLGNDHALAAGLGINGTIYEDADLSSLSINQSIEVRRLIDTGYIGFGVVSNQSMNVADKALNSYAVGPRISVVHAFNNSTTFSGNATFEWRNSNEDYNEGLDGTAVLLNGSLTRGFGNGFSLTGKLGYEDVNVEQDSKSYQTISGELSIHKELPWGITADVSGRLAYSEFDGPLFFITDLGIREDWRTTASLELTKRDLNILGFAPAINYTYTNNDSSIFLFNFDNHSVDLRFTKDF